jgi:hypothetical protein
METYEIFKGGTLVNAVIADQAFIDQHYGEGSGYTCTKRVDVAAIRTKRNTLLAASDWTQIPDAPVDQAAWATYRQALRDITAQVGFPESIDWPVQPV